MMPIPMIKKSSLKPINGLLLVNKHQGLTSNAVLKKVKWLYQAQKAGHTGSLDPLATGMLPLCFGEATKFCQYLLDADKSYIATGLLGVLTNTGDSDGETIAVKTAHDPITQAQLEAVLLSLLGSIKQVPPMFSALKQNGIPLYKLARAGISVERAERAVEIRAIELLDFDGKQFTIRVICSKGTYIRSLVETIGEQLNSYAHVTMLHRLYTGNFNNHIMYSVDDLSTMTNEALLACLLPIDNIVDYLPKQILENAEISLLQQGKVLANRNFSHELVRLYNPAGVFIGLGTSEGDMLKAKRLLNFN